jgi:hypothetical protein
VKTIWKIQVEKENEKMRRNGIHSNAILFVLLLGLVFSKSAFAESLTKRNSGGGVELSLELLNPELLLTGEDIVFDVSMNTHSVSLDEYKLDEISYLRNDGGVLFKAISWESPKGGGHHLFGKLRFPGTDNAGKKIFTDGAGYMEVVITGLSNVKERIFRWTLPI